MNLPEEKNEGDPCTHILTDCPKPLECQKKDPNCNDNGENTCDKVCTKPE